MRSAAIPSFYLYGEPPRAVDGRFLHVEGLDDRSRPSEWTIQPHAHPDLHQVFFIREGSGTLTVEGEALDFRAPCLMRVPAGAVHGFAYQAESAGTVLTLAVSFYEQLAVRAPDVARLFEAAARSDATGAQAELDALFSTLERELSWIAPGHATAVEAGLLSLLVAALRLSSGPASGVALGADADLVAHFRALVGRSLRQVRPLTFYAEDLGVPLTRLRTACRSVAGKGPLRIIRERRLLEAKRMLAYSDLKVGQIAYALGLDDAAYFSRLFSRSEGCSPITYRKSTLDAKARPTTRSLVGESQGSKGGA